MELIAIVLRNFCV